jgi:hypothetical protein
VQVPPGRLGRVDPLFWAAGSYDLPSSTNLGNQAYLSGVKGLHTTTTSSIPAMKEDCNQFVEKVTLYAFDNTTKDTFKPLYTRTAKGSWNPGGANGEGPHCDVVAPDDNGFNYSGTFSDFCDANGNSKVDNPPVLCYPTKSSRIYRFQIQTTGRTSFQDTSLVVYTVVLGT